MRKTVSISDLRRRMGRVLSRLAKSGAPVTITRRGRDAAVIMSSARYDEIEESLRRLDELDLREMVRAAEVGEKRGGCKRLKKLVAGGDLNSRPWGYESYASRSQADYSFVTLAYTIRVR
jgi:prevent-host-death family protein